MLEILEHLPYIIIYLDLLLSIMLVGTFVIMVTKMLAFLFPLFCSFCGIVTLLRNSYLMAYFLYCNLETILHGKPRLLWLSGLACLHIFVNYSSG